MQNVKERLFGRREKAYGFYENLRPGEKEFLQDFLKFLDSLVRAGEFRTDKFRSDNLLVLASPLELLAGRIPPKVFLIYQQDAQVVLY